MFRVYHFEIPAGDTEKTAEFYRKVFGWDIKKWENEAGVDYQLVMTGEMDAPGGINGGIMKRRGPKAKDNDTETAFVCTIQVPSAEEYSKKVEDAGGKITAPKMGVPGVGWLVYAKDIDGNTFGMLQEDKEAV
ncbi:MAG: VOC family protein [Patescibacteria group bacterium]